MRKVNKLWGNEEPLVNNELYCSKFLNLNLGFQSSLHYHKIKDETFYTVYGSILLEVEENNKIETYTLNEGDYYRIKPNIKHRFRALTDRAVVLETSTHDDFNDSYRIENSKKI